MERRARLAFFDDADRCRFCGHYGPNLTHSFTRARGPAGEWQVVSLHCTECDPSGATCWQRPGRELKDG